MKDYPFDQPIVWHVLFHPGRCLWDRHWRHVSLAGYHDDTWLHLDVQRGGMGAATLYRHDDVQDYLTFLLAYTTVVKFGFAHEQSRSFFSPLTCVSHAKHVLGIRSGALRPSGLMRDLLSQYDAKVLNEHAQDQRNGGTKAATAES